jgi:hypothetical protein
VLNAVGRRVAADFGELPAVLALGRTQQDPHIGHGPLPRLGALKVGAQAPLNVVQVGGPPWTTDTSWSTSSGVDLCIRLMIPPSLHALGIMRARQRFNYHCSTSGRSVS